MVLLIPFKYSYTSGYLDSGKIGSEFQPFYKGVEMIYENLKDVLGREGLQQFSSLGEEFNPERHEAVVALEPDVVVLVPSAQQRDLCSRLRGLGIEVVELANIDLEQLLGAAEYSDHIGAERE